jgi:hypothetical protein
MRTFHTYDLCQSVGNDGITDNTVMNISDVTTEQQPISRHEKDGTPP